MLGYKTYYFKGVRGRAEPIRLFLSIAGQKDEQENFEFKSEEWNIRKKELPLQQIPVLRTEDGTMLPHSFTIMRYLGKKHGFCGKTFWDETMNDCMMESVNDFVSEIAWTVYPWMLWGEEKPSDAEKRIEKCRAILIKVVEYFEKYSKEKGSKFINGDEIEICDIWCYTNLEFVKKLFPDSLELNDWVKNWVKNFTEDERVKKYLAERPDLGESSL